MEITYVNCKFHTHLKSQDIFIPEVDPNKMEGRNPAAHLEYQKKMFRLKMEYDKVKIVLNLRACRPSILLQFQLEKIRIAKKMFILELT